MQFVADASITLSWCFEDEATPWTDSLLDRLRNGDQILSNTTISIWEGLLFDAGLSFRDGRSVR